MFGHVATSKLHYNFDIYVEAKTSTRWLLNVEEKYITYSYKHTTLLLFCIIVVIFIKNIINKPNRFKIADRQVLLCVTNVMEFIQQTVT